MEYILPEIIRDLWFQHDRAHAHFTTDILKRLNAAFSGR